MHDLGNDSMVQSKYAVTATTVIPYRYDRGRVKLEDEADEFRVPMPEFDRLRPDRRPPASAKDEVNSNSQILSNHCNDATRDSNML